MRNLLFNKEIIDSDFIDMILYASYVESYNLLLNLPIMSKHSQIINENFYTHCWKITSQVPGMQVYHTPGLSLSHCGISCDTFNIIYLQDTGKLTPDDIHTAKAYFEQKNMAYTLWAEESHLTDAARNILDEAGIRVTNKEPGMLLYLPSCSLESKHTFVNIQKAETPEQVLHYARIVAHNWNPPDENLISYYIKASPAILATGSPASMYVYYHAGVPVAAIELFVSDQHTAGIYNLSTLELFRGQGMGTALISYALHEAKQQGYIYAVLQASEAGLRIYQKLGFTTETYFYELHG
jgi:GNAT superfamily N-acetyltransferase